MEAITAIINTINGIVWGWPMLVLILGTGLFLTVRLGFMPLRKLGLGFRIMWQGRHSEGEGDISSFNALMTALAATVGTGNIAGVGTAVAIGGPGALFWMWCTALVGMATKYAEAVLAVKYREEDEEKNHIGGPMFYIKNGLGKQWMWLGTLFAIFGALAGFGIGNTIQAHSVADVLHANFNVPPLATGVGLAILTAVVLIGGIKRLGEVAGKLVPFMALAYVIAGLVIILINIAAVPTAIIDIVRYAFSPVAAVGGFAGATIMLALQKGVARGVFSNEAGLGSAPIAHAAAKTKDPVQQGTVAMLGTFIDTIIICSITGLVIMVTGVWQGGLNGAALSSAAFEAGMPGGKYVVIFGLAIFAYTTLLGWSFYGEKCVEYLFGYKAIWPFRVLWIIAIPVGATLKLSFAWLVADTLNAFMAIPNLIALLLLSGVVVQLTKEYFAKQDNV